jgi:hypothetical protein
LVSGCRNRPQMMPAKPGLSNWIRATSTRIQGAHRPMGDTRVGSQTEGLETGYYTSFCPLDQRKMQILAARVGNPRDQP